MCFSLQEQNRKLIVSAGCIGEGLCPLTSGEATFHGVHQAGISLDLSSHALSRRGPPGALGLADRDTGSPDSAQTQLQDFPSQLRSSLSPCPSLSTPSLCVNP